jgi:hypothetical protein
MSVPMCAPQYQILSKRVGNSADRQICSPVGALLDVSAFDLGKIICCETPCAAGRQIINEKYLGSNNLIRKQQFRSIRWQRDEL